MADKEQALRQKGKDYRRRAKDNRQNKKYPETSVHNWQDLHNAKFFVKFAYCLLLTNFDIWKSSKTNCFVLRSIQRVQNCRACLTRRKNWNIYGKEIRHFGGSNLQCSFLSWVRSKGTLI